MTAIAIDGPRGLAPRFDPTLLNTNQAQVATDAYLVSGALQPWADMGEPKTVDQALEKNPGDPIRTIWLYQGDYWFHWAVDADVSLGPVADDDHARAYFTLGDDTPPQMTVFDKALHGDTGTWPEVAYNLGVPAPSNPLDYEEVTDCDPAFRVDTAYVYTYVSAYGEEGPPSPVAGPLTRCTDVAVELSGMDTGPSGAYNIVAKRLYRAASGANATEYLFVTELTVGETSFTDDVTDANLSNPIPSTTWEGPPEGLQGLTILPNGIAAGFVGRDIYLSEPYRPHAWPRAYRQTLTDPIVGLGAFGSNLVVCTEGAPVLMQGSTPASMTGADLGLRQSCVSKRGILSLPGAGVVYPSPDGLVMVNSSGGQMLTGGLLAKADWDAYNPPSIMAAMYEGRYVGFYDNGTTRAGFILDPSDPESGLTETTLHATAAHNDLRHDALYLVDDAGDLGVWHAGSGVRPYTWRSKPFVVGTVPSFAAAKVVARTYGDLTFRLYADGVLRHTQTVTSGAAFRLPGGFRARTWEIELAGTAPVTRAVFGDSMEEVARA